MAISEKDHIEVIKSEIEDDYSDDSLFNISSWGADLSFRELVSMYNDNELVKPELQRKYVWDKIEASRFIESILLGLPVPSIFLAQSGSQKLIVDGYQRIMTVYDYIRGIFTTDNKSFLNLLILIESIFAGETKLLPSYQLMIKEKSKVPPSMQSSLSRKSQKTMILVFIKFSNV